MSPVGLKNRDKDEEESIEEREEATEVVEEIAAEERPSLADWEPKTELGRKVKSGEIKTIHEALIYPRPIKEVEIIDALLPNLEEEIIDVTRVQRVTDSGRRTKFRVVVVVGNRDGYVGVGEGKAKEAGPAIRKAIRRAKLNIKEIKRGCGSWECGCGEPHSVPFTVEGKWGSVRVKLIPAPRGTGLVCGDIAKKVLSLAGISDIWVNTRGNTRTSINYAHAVLNALENINRLRFSEEDVKKLGIISGSGL